MAQGKKLARALIGETGEDRIEVLVVKGGRAVRYTFYSPGPNIEFNRETAKLRPSRTNFRISFDANSIITEG